MGSPDGYGRLRFLEPKQATALRRNSRRFYSARPCHVLYALHDPLAPTLRNAAEGGCVPQTRFLAALAPFSIFAQLLFRLCSASHSRHSRITIETVILS